MYILDRFEGQIAVIATDRGSMDVPRDLMPETAKEGDVLEQVVGGYVINERATQARREKLLRRTKQLRK